jgi:hypothetical protein
MKRLIYILLFCLPLCGFGQGYLLNPYAFEVPSGNLLLDSFPGASAAFSLRKLDKDYAGNCIRVRRTSDNAEQNIGFTGGYCDTASLKSFCASTNCTVTTWYDQSGNGKNATQTTAASQPRIVISGSIIRYGGTPVLQRDSQTVIIPGNITGLTNQSIFTAAALRVDVNESTPGFLLLAADSSIFTNGIGFGVTTGLLTNERLCWLTVAAPSAVRGAGQVTTNIPQGRYVFTQLFQQSPTIVQIYQNATLQTLVPASLNGGFSSINYPNRWNIGMTANMTSFTNNSLIEVVLYPSYQSANRAQIEGNINRFYAIY